MQIGPVFPTQSGTGMIVPSIWGTPAGGAPKVWVDPPTAAGAADGRVASSSDCAVEVVEPSVALTSTMIRMPNMNDRSGRNPAWFQTVSAAVTTCVGPVAPAMS